MKFWKRKVQTLTREEIDRSVADPAWQEFRLSLKGLPTAEKLDQLQLYLDNMMDDYGSPLDVTYPEALIQVDNYINALLRGGQLRRICHELLVVAK